MALLGSLLKRSIKVGHKIDNIKSSPFRQQYKELRKLLNKAKNTEIGLKYNFAQVLNELSIFNRKKKSMLFYDIYKKNVPIYDYNSIYNEFWIKTLDNKENVTWPGVVKYFAVSSGTSESASKYIPITKAMRRAILKTSFSQLFILSHYDHLPSALFEKGMLLLGGSTSLNFHGNYYSGDLTGINAAKLPFWFDRFYKPGKKISKNKNWEDKLNEITEAASNWDIGYIVGVPAWIQILIEKIIKHYKVQHIHEIWPNLSVYCHGGVSFEPYKKSFEKLLGKPLIYLETYLASEGFIAFQAKPESKGMKMMLNSGIFFEFIPFNDKNFDVEGQLLPHPETYMINEVEEGKEYALLLSTCAGAWRYLIGDVVKILDKEEHEIIITGRTKHFLSMCGEHLSIDNMNKAIQSASEHFNIDIQEFTVAGVPYQNLFAHQWYIGSTAKIDEIELKDFIDSKLMELNDDYQVERTAALKDVFVKVLHPKVFLDWMKSNGKFGGQNKFVRVMKGENLTNWQNYLTTNNLN